MGIFRTEYFPSAEPKPRRLYYLIRLLPERRCGVALNGAGYKILKQNAQDKEELSLIAWTWGPVLKDLRAYLELQLVDMGEFVVQWYMMNCIFECCK